MSDTPPNTFTDGPLGTFFLNTALPIIPVTGINGLLPGTDTFATVTLMFPTYMLTVALSTLVSNGIGPSGPIAATLLCFVTILALWKTAYNTGLKGGVLHKEQGRLS
jgi:hypothetical protein